MNKPFLQAIANHFKKHRDFFLIGPMRASNGAMVPIYPEMRKLYSNLEAVETITTEIAKIFKKMIVEIVAGAATAGVPLAMAVSLKTNLTFVYIKKERKKFLASHYVEGDFHKGQRGVLLDDAVGWGNTKKLLIYNALKEGLIIKDIICLYDSYTHEPEKRKWFKKQGIKIQALASREEIFEYLNKQGLISDEIVEINRFYTHQPKEWNLEPKNWEKFLAWHERWLKKKII